MALERPELKVIPTPEDAGLECTIRIVAYDKGMFMVNSRACGADTTWADIAALVGSHVAELSRKMRDRKAEREAEARQAVRS